MGMTREETIKILKQFRDRQGNSSDDNEALDMAIKALEQQPCEDCISIGVFEQVKWERDVAIEQLEQLGYSLGEKIRTSEDCISREDAINTAIEAVDEWDGGCNTNRATMICKAIKNLPSVTPTRAKGKWVKAETEGRFYCSICGGIHNDLESGEWREVFDFKYPYCPNCGADMRESEVNADDSSNDT